MRVEGRANSPYVCLENYCGKRHCDTEQKMRFSWNQNGLLSKWQPRGLLRRGDLEILRTRMLVSVFWIKNVWRTGCGLRRLTAEQFRRMGHPGICERQEDPGSTCRVRTWLLDKGQPSVHHIHTNDWHNDLAASYLGIRSYGSLFIHCTVHVTIQPGSGL